MSKDFKTWHYVKSHIDQNKKEPFFREKEIWFCSLGLNVGHEQDGKGNLFLRPVIIMKKIARRLAIIVPLTTKIKNKPHRYNFKIKNKLNSALYSQVRLIDTKRLEYRSIVLDDNIFNEIKKNLRRLLS